MSKCFRIMRQVPNIIHQNEYQYNRIYNGAIKTIIFDKRGIQYSGKLNTDIMRNDNLIIKELSNLDLILDIKSDTFLENLLQNPNEYNKLIDKNRNIVYEHNLNKIILNHCLKLNPPTLLSEKKNIPDFNDIKIGILTDFSINISKILQTFIKSKGYQIDYYSSSQQVKHSGPFLMYHNLDVLNTKPIQSVIKLDNTESAISDSLDSGCWSVGIADWRFWENREESRKILTSYGSHYVIDSINELPMVVDDINLKMYYGGKP